jgi:hypothetical protein
MELSVGFLSLWPASALDSDRLQEMVEMAWDLLLAVRAASAQDDESVHGMMFPAFTKMPVMSDHAKQQDQDCSETG